MITHIYDQWMDGDLTATAALRALCMNLGEVEDQLATLEQERSQLRNEIGIIVARLGETVTVKGFGTLSVSAPSKTASYDRKALDALMLHLVEQGASDMAESIAACRKETMRAGGLRIEREKGQ